MNRSFFEQAIRMTFVFALAVILLLPGNTASADTYDGEVTQIIIKYGPGFIPADPAGTVQMARLTAATYPDPDPDVALTYVRALPGGAHVLALPGSTPMSEALVICDNLEEYLMDVNDNRELMYAVPYVTPDDPLYPNVDPKLSQWNLFGSTGINAPMAWGIETGSEGIIVAVLDSGIQPHADLDRVLLTGYDFVSDVTRDNDVEDGDGNIKGRDAVVYDPGELPGAVCGETAWQGTHVAGIIGAASNNAEGIAGIDWNAQILPVRVIGSCGYASATDVLDGMKWAAGLEVTGTTQRVTGGDPANDPAKVIQVSASIAGQACTPEYQTAVNDLLGTGAVIVAAAGDSPNLLYPSKGGKDVTTNNNFPANCNGVITVAATDRLGNRAEYSNYGAAVEISAPGGGGGQGEITSTTNTGANAPTPGGDAYEGLHGTAMAAAHVSGVVSLMASIKPDITPALTLKILQSGVSPFGVSNCTTALCGAGIVNAGESVRAMSLPDLVITNVVITDMGGNPKLGVDAKGNPELKVALNEEFLAKVTVENWGGTLADSIAALQAYADRDPMSTLKMGFQGALYNTDGELDLGEFEEPDGSVTIDPGATVTLDFSITWTDESAWGDGSHKLYFYVDANGINKEGFENNNHFAPVEINPYVRGLLLYPDAGENIELDYSPIFKWNKVDGATKYRVFVTKLPTTKAFDLSFDAAVICDTKTPTCSANAGPKPLLKAGSYSWKIMTYKGTVMNTNWTAVPANFTVGVPDQPELVSPMGGGTLDTYTPVYVWKPVNTASSYTVQIKKDIKIISTKTYKAASICTEAECRLTSPLLGVGAYTWKVLASNPLGAGLYSAEAAFSTSAALPAASTLVYPLGTEATPEEITTYTPVYTWDRVVGATSYLVQVKMGTKVIFSKTYATSACNETECKATSPLLKVGNYEWQVKAVSPAGFSWSAISYFRTPGTLADVVLTDPINPLLPTTNFTPVYTWDNVPGATSYLVQVYREGRVVWKKSLTAAAACKGTSVCMVTSPLLKAGPHTWQVQATSPAGFMWSHIEGFTTPTTVDKAGLIEPKDGVVLDQYAPTYKWMSVPGATSYVLKIWRGTLLIATKTYKPTVCSVDTGVCAVASPLLKAGEHTWQIWTYTPATAVIDPDTKKPIGPSISDSAVFVTNPEKPYLVILISPEGDIGADYSPTYKWNRDEHARATSFLIQVRNAAGTLVLNKSYTAASICNVDTCQTPKSTLLKGGTYTWKVQSYSPAGYGDWSETKTFIINLPAKPVLTYPYQPDLFENIGSNYNPRYQWQKVDLATRYLVTVKSFVKPGSTKTTTVLNKWFYANDICDEFTCTVPVLYSPTLKGGIHTWQVQAANSAGASPVSDLMRFQTDTQTIPGAILNLSINPQPNANPKQKPTYTWRHGGTMATTYYLYVKGNSGAVVLNKKYRAADICIDNTCSVASPTTLLSEKYTWWVQAYNTAGYGPWRNSTFNIPYVPAAAQNLVTTGTTDKPTYTWDEVPAATSYHLYVVSPSGEVILNTWKPTSICTAGTCSVESPDTLGAGDYTWSVLASSDLSRYGVWTTQTYTVPTP